MDEKAPREVDFDTIVQVLRKEDKDTACVFNCQVKMKSAILDFWNYNFSSQLSYATHMGS